MLEASYLKESVFKDCGEKSYREREKSKSITRNQKALKKVEQFKWDWLCLSVDPCNIDKQHLVNLKQQQVRFVAYDVLISFFSKNIPFIHRIPIIKCPIILAVLPLLHIFWSKRQSDESRSPNFY